MTVSGILLLWPSGWSRERKSTATMLVASALVVAFLWTLGTLLSHVPGPVGENAQQFADGTKVTLELTILSGLLGILLGVLSAMGQRARVKPLRWLVGLYIWVFRGTPLLVQIMFVYFALPKFSDDPFLDSFLPAALALALNVGAYNSEAIRAGLEAIPKGQTEAARSLGLSPLQTFVHVVFPQGIKIALPSLVNNVVALLKDSSLAYTIGVVELTNIGDRLRSRTFEPVDTLLTTAAIYLVLTTILTQISDAIEHRLDVQGKVA